jgi:hypothetical protein
MTSGSDALNDALERLQDFAFFDWPGLACHGPMGAETLTALGHDEIVAGWADEYRRRHVPISGPMPSARIHLTVAADFHCALGKMERVADWKAAFADQLREQRWQEVVNRWARRLAVGYAGAFTHGLIRVAHAVRALEGCPEPSALLLDELANGLALWAASFKMVPGQPILRGPLRLADALAALPRPEQPWPTTEARTFARLAELDEFDVAVEELGPPPPEMDPLSLLSASFCSEMLAHTEVSAVPLVHTVTPIAATRTLLRYMPDITAEDMYGLLWGVGAAIVVSFTPRGGSAPTDSGVDPPSPAHLVTRAIEHRDPHVLKFTDACLREHALNPDPCYLHAIHHVLRQTPRWLPKVPDLLVS